MKEFSIELGGKARPLKFHTLDALELKRRFNEGARSLIWSKTMGLSAEPDEKGQYRSHPFRMDQEVQIAVLHLALKRGGWNVTEAKLIDHLDAFTQPPSNGSFSDLVVIAAKAALYSGGITGESVDLDAEAKDEDEEAAGKAEPVPSETT